MIKVCLELIGVIRLSLPALLSCMLDISNDLLIATVTAAVHRCGYTFIMGLPKKSYVETSREASDQIADLLKFTDHACGGD